jgi:glutathione S-transferase
LLVLKVWGRNTSVNVQKVMWAIGELDLPHERIDIGGPFGKNKDPEYLGMNPNGLVPTLQEDGFLLWESNSIVRYLAAKHGAGRLEPADLRERARASSWMDWQISVAGPAIFGMFWGLIRTPPEKRDHAAIDASREKTAAAMKILDAQLGKTAFVAGDRLSMGDIPVALMAYRFRRLAPERTGLANLERWFAGIEQRPAFKQHVLAIPFV